MHLAKHAVSAAATLLGLSTSNAFYAGRLSVQSGASELKLASGDKACQRQQPSARTLLRSSSSRSSRALSMSGFGGGKAKKPKETPPKLTSGESVARTALKEYNQIKRGGGTVAKVYARLKGTEEWFPVGSVCTEAGKTAEGTQGQKRLILEHAAEMYDQLRSGAGVTLVLEAGYASEPGGDIVVCKAKYSGEIVGVALDPLPSGPFFRDVGKAGFGKDSSSAATLMDKAKYT